MKKVFILMTILAMILMSTSCTSSTINDSVPNSVPDTDVNQESKTVVSAADLSGEIFEIIGNEVTLRIVEPSEADKTETTRVPGSGKGRTGETIERNFTGENLDLLIPVGTLIVTRVPQSGTQTGTGTGPVEKEIGLNDLVKGTFLKIYYMEDGKTIEKIVAQAPRQ